MTPWLRKFALTAHVTVSVGWLGAVACFLALAVTGLTSEDGQLVRSAYLAMELTGWLVIVPLSGASLVTGLVQSLGTTWGLFRHYWVVMKLVINVLATVLLLLHMQPTGRIAGVAAAAPLSDATLRGLRIQLVGDDGAAVVALLRRDDALPVQTARHHAVRVAKTTRAARGVPALGAPRVCVRPRSPAGAAARSPRR